MCGRVVSCMLYHCGQCLKAISVMIFFCAHDSLSLLQMSGKAEREIKSSSQVLVYLCSRNRSNNKVCIEISAFHYAVLLVGQNESVGT